MLNSNYNSKLDLEMGFLWVAFFFEKWVICYPRNDKFRMTRHFELRDSKIEPRIVSKNLKRVFSHKAFKLHLQNESKLIKS